jgi:lipoprotein signal peptidase
MIRGALRSYVAAPTITRRLPLALLAASAGAVVVLDDATKLLALHVLPELDPAPAGVVQLGILRNADLAWGLSAGADSGALSALAALVILALSVAVCGALAAYDRAAPLALGLIVGAGAANAADAFASPTGVVDWVALRVGSGGVVFNLADLAVAAGIGLCARTALRLAAALARERANRK